MKISSTLTIWKVKYLMLFRSYILATVLTRRHTNLILKSFTFSKTFLRIPPISKSSMLLPLDPVPLVEKLKRVHLQGYVWLNALKANLLLFSTECYGWKARANHNVIVIYWKLTATIYCK